MQPKQKQKQKSAAQALLTFVSIQVLLGPCADFGSVSLCGIPRLWLGDGHGAGATARAVDDGRI